MAALRVILADEHNLFLEGMKRILGTLTKPKIEVVEVAKTGKDLLQIIENVEADLILSELNFADVEYEALIPGIKANQPQVKLMLVSAYGEMKLVRSCFTLGADGFLHKSNSLENLQKGLSEVMQDRVFLGEGLQVAPSQLEGDLPESNPVKALVQDRFSLKQKLTRREEEVLRLIVAGKNNRQIGKDLFISDQTVGVHKKNIMKKFSVNSTSALIHFSKENRIV